jgi:hypothetical protein
LTEAPPRGYHVAVQARRPARPEATPTFEQFQASELYCSRCRAPRPVRERLLLYLPDGELWEYVCAECGASLGSRRVAGALPGLS